LLDFLFFILDFYDPARGPEGTPSPAIRLFSVKHPFIFRLVVFRLYSRSLTALLLLISTLRGLPISQRSSPFCPKARPGSSADVLALARCAFLASPVAIIIKLREEICATQNARH
jgi:hypothetical protein